MVNQQCNGSGLRELALFAGAGGGILGSKLLGWRTVAAVEWGEYPASVLCARQNEGLLPPFPIWSDVQTFDGRTWRGRVDVVSGGFPCQDISVSGKGAGIDGERSGMWSHMARIIGEVRPRFAFVENSPALISRGLGRVLGDLAALGYDCRWGVLGASDIGANHQRDRFWLVATYANSVISGDKWEKEVRSDGSMDQREAKPINHGDTEQMADTAQLQCNGSHHHAELVMEHDPVSKSGNHCGAAHLADTDSAQRQRNERAQRTQPEYADAGGSSWWASEPDIRRVANGVAARVDRLKAIGNGQVPLCAATAWRMLGGQMT